MSRTSGLVAVAAAALLSLAAGDARADQERTVQWNEAWPRVRWIELLDTVALSFATGAIHASPSPATTDWKGGILFDEPLRKVLSARTRVGQERAALLSDYLYRGMVVTPYIIDNFVTALGVHQNADVALQLTLINMQSLGLSGVVTLGTQHLIARERPYASGCLGPTKADAIGFNTCGDGDDLMSFYSGHAAAMFTMAGLTCAHHQHLPLYGGGAPDALACALMVGLATTGSVMRLVADRHWASDAIIGSSVGVLSGYLVPVLLHYGIGWNRAAIPTTVQTSFGRVAPIPQVYNGGAGLGFAVF